LSWSAAAIRRLEEGLFLTRFASSVTIVHRRDSSCGRRHAAETRFRQPQGQFHLGYGCDRGGWREKLKHLKLKNVVTGEESTLEADGLFIFIGHTPNTQMFEGSVGDARWRLHRLNHLMETNVPGVFVAGEVADNHFRQVVTSAGMGAAAAIQATHFLESVSAAE
jgi:thioredoxin reductase (NADPH)